MFIFYRSSLNIAFQPGGFDNWSWSEFGKSVVIGGVSGAVGGWAVGAAGFGTVGFVNGAMSGLIGGSVGGFVNGALTSWTSGGSLAEGFANGLKGGVIGGLSGFGIGGIFGGISAYRHGGDFWSGKGSKFDAVIADKSNTMSSKDYKLGKNMEYSNRYAQKFSNNNFGKNVKGVDNLYADGSMPNGYLTRGDAVYNSAGQEVGGCTVYNGFGKGSDVFLYKALFVSSEQLYLGMGHEYLHAAYNAIGYSDMKFTRNHEAAISQWEYYQAQKLLGNVPNYIQNNWSKYNGSLLNSTHPIGQNSGTNLIPLVNSVKGVSVW